MSLTNFPPAGVGAENPPAVMCAPVEARNPSEGLAVETAGGAVYAGLQLELDEAFAAMEVTWKAWRESRPNQVALDAYLESLSACNTIHKILKKFPQYETFPKNFPKSPSSDVLGLCVSHGVDRHGDVGGEGMAERPVRGGGDVVLCPRRSALGGTAIRRGLAFGEPGGAGKIIRNRALVRSPMRPEVQVLWVALATVILVPAVGVILHVLFSR